MRRFRQAFWQLFLVPLLGVWWLMPATGAAETAFFSDLPDIPLIEGFQEQSAEAFSFDTPAGRIVEAEATGASEPAALLLFYSQVLRELGWVNFGQNDYVRDGELLSIEVSEASETGRNAPLLRVRLYLRPK